MMYIATMYTHSPLAYYVFINQWILNNATTIMWKDVQYILSIKIRKQMMGSVAKRKKKYICMDQVSVV